MEIFQSSPKRQSLFENVNADMSPSTVGFHTLFPTGWAERNEIFCSILENCDVFCSSVGSILSNYSDSKTRARVNGVANQMKMFYHLL